MPAKEKKPKEESKAVDPSDQLNSFLKHKDHAKNHYNFIEEIYYKVSFGSLKLDIELGGIGPGFHRFCGRTEGGKTSEALEVCKNFLKEPNRRAIYIKCEGRLSREMQARSGVKFVFGDPSDWKDGTCYVHESNIFENVLTMIKGFVDNNPTKKQYLFIVDSLDTMIREGDRDKSFGQAHQVGGGATLMSHFFKHMALPTVKFGHMMIMLSQVRKDIPASQYVAARQENYSGGNASMHQPDLTLEFLARGSVSGDHYFTEKEGKPSENNRIIGHNCVVRVEKSSNEKSKMIFTYPIKYGRSGGTSIWVEKEIIDLLLSFELLNKKGAWFSFDVHTADVAISEGLVVEDEEGVSLLKKQYQGEQKVQDLLTDHPEILSYFYKKLQSELKN